MVGKLVLCYHTGIGSNIATEVIMNKRIGLDNGEIVDSYIKDGILHIHLEIPVVNALMESSDNDHAIPRAGDVLDILDEMGFENRYDIKKGGQYTRITSFKIKNSLFVLYELKDFLIVGLASLPFLGNTNVFSFLHYIGFKKLANGKLSNEVTHKYFPFYAEASKFSLLINEINTFISGEINIEQLTYLQECNAFAYSWDFVGPISQPEQVLCPIHYPPVEVEKDWGSSFSEFWIGSSAAMEVDFHGDLRQKTQRKGIYLPCSYNSNDNKATSDYNAWILKDEGWINEEDFPKTLKEIFTEYPLIDYTPLLRKLEKERIFIPGIQDTRFPHITRFKFESKAELKQFFSDLGNQLDWVF
jgi:hypothetical protein